MKKLVVLVCTLLFWQNLVFAEQKPIGIKSSKDQDEKCNYRYISEVIFYKCLIVYKVGA